MWVTPVSTPITPLQADSVSTTAGGVVLETMSVDLSKRNRYLRLVHTGAGGSAAGFAMAIILLFNGRYLGVTQDPADVLV